jgi:hypothetical protein
MLTRRFRQPAADMIPLFPILIIVHGREVVFKVADGRVNDRARLGVGHRQFFHD